MYNIYRELEITSHSFLCMEIYKLSLTFVQKGGVALLWSRQCFFVLGYCSAPRSA